SLKIGRPCGDLRLKHIWSWKIHAGILKLRKECKQSNRVVADTVIDLPALPLHIKAKEQQASKRDSKDSRNENIPIGNSNPTYRAPCKPANISLTALIAALSLSGSRERTTRLVFGFWFSSMKG